MGDGDPVPVGSRWRDREKGNRLMTVLRPGGNGWWFRYDDEPDTMWTCCAEDFTVWNRFERVLA